MYANTHTDTCSALYRTGRAETHQKSVCVRKVAENAQGCTAVKLLLIFLEALLSVN